MTADFQGRVAIVSGAASGISRVILTRLAAAGACVTIADIDNEWGSATARELGERGCEALYCHTDVRDSGQVDRMVAETVERFGRVDILVHGAGVGVHKEIVDLSDDEWDLQLDVQLRGAFLLSRAVGRRLIEQGEGGRIILIGSTSGNNARPKAGPHAASKAAEIQLARVMALELGRYGITSNVVSPGLTTSPASHAPRSHRSTSRFSSNRCRWAAWARRTRSPTRCSSLPLSRRASSPGRCSTWTAATPPASYPSKDRTGPSTTAS